MSVNSKVALGVKWLDENHPGWKRKVDTNTLNMNHPNKCVLSQVFERSYYNVSDILGENFCESHGFIGNNTEYWLDVLNETFNLRETKVEPGEYEIVSQDFPNAAFAKGNKLVVLDQTHIEQRFPEVKNLVFCPLNYKVYLDCPVLVKKTNSL